MKKSDLYYVGAFLLIVAVVVVLGVFGIPDGSNMFARRSIESAPTATIQLRVRVTATPSPRPVTPTLTPRPKWYEQRSTLYTASLSEWDRGQSADKLATAARWVLDALGLDSMPNNSDQRVTIRQLSEWIVDCVDESAGLIDASLRSQDSSARVAARICWENME